MEKMQGEMFLKNAMPQTEEINQSFLECTLLFLEELTKLRDIECYHLRKISEENETRKGDLETERKNLIKKDEIRKLVGEQKREREGLLRKISQDITKLVKKQGLEIEIVSLRGKIEIMKLTNKDIVDSLQKELYDKQQLLLPLH